MLSLVSLPAYARIRELSERGAGTLLGVVRLLFTLLAIVPAAGATPPHYNSFHREQRVDYSPRDDQLLRIWVVDVRQGDGILIQLPEAFVSERGGQTTGSSGDGRIEILIDGGPQSTRYAPILAFLRKLYSSGAVLEHAVLTHNDADHLKGMSAVLKDEAFAIETVYHSGLASYAPGTRLFPSLKADLPGRAVVVKEGAHLQRGLALVDNGGLLDLDYLIDDLLGLEQAEASGLLEGNYSAFAKAATVEAKPVPIEGFVCTHTDGTVAENGLVRRLNGAARALRFEVLWPESRPRSYEDKWDRTTNGNSVMFRLEYGDFSMLFTGDLHSDGQAAWMSTLGGEEVQAKLACDVLKLPHHGSDDTQEAFLKHAAPVVSVASMGSLGFRSKKVSRNAYQHPSSDIIRQLGGAHRVYHTHIQEKKFDWNAIGTPEQFEALREKMLEGTHILIETDGLWFRVVETDDPRNRPSVAQTRRGNGTRWIKSR